MKVFGCTQLGTAPIHKLSRNVHTAHAAASYSSSSRVRRWTRVMIWRLYQTAASEDLLTESDHDWTRRRGRFRM
ncbi:hypothetical protein Mapa_006174 [Marchantia paleacea]|nr:hypothetical protein Mapa_006174 [Marchantia paleacea]